MKGEDVRALQKLMNCLGFTLGRNGPGSVGNETDVFAKRTDAAVKHFQEMYSSDILAPVSATKGTGIFAAYSKKKAKTLTAQ
jgi:peptidoglycan hydrolase-like protein with peptidoglycan-binding domain